jgi:hypothetical protein
MKWFTLIGLAVAASATVIYFRGGPSTLPFWPQPTRQMQEVTFAGNEVPDPDPDALYINGYVIKNDGNVRLKDFYVQYERYLGPPISAFNGRQMAFVGGRVTYSPDHAEGWQLEIESLGIADLQVAGLRPTQNSAPHPVVRQFLVAEYEAGVDLVRVYGPVASEEHCSKTRCSQWLAKQKLTWPAGDLTADRVAREPLGLYFTFPGTRFREVPDDDPTTGLSLPWLVVGGIVVGLFLLSRSGGQSRRLAKF